jgi:hypothetical protein
MVQPRSCWVIYYFDTPTLGRRHQLFGRVSENGLSVALWCEPRDHVTHTPIPGKPCKSGLIGVWHKNNLYLRTSTIENKKSLPNEYWFANEKYKDDATKPVVLW